MPRGGEGLAVVGVGDVHQRVGALAEAEGHHPDLELAWGRVGVALWTHSVGGLSENDFILAARMNALPATG